MMTMKTKLMILIYLEKILKPILRNILTLKTVKTMEMKPTNLKSSLKKSKKKVMTIVFSRKERIRLS